MPSKIEIQYPIIDTPKGKFYLVDGKLCPRVTNILSVVPKPFLLEWRGKWGNTHADRVTKEAQDFGTLIHDYCHRIAVPNPKKPIGLLPKHVKPIVDSFRTWFHTYVEEVVQAETTVVSREFWFAGTMDLVAVMKGDTEPSIIDIKTSRLPSVEWPLQLSAYRLALKEEGTPTHRRIIVQLPKEGNPAAVLYEYENHVQEEYIFKNALTVWQWLQDNDQNMEVAKKLWANKQLS